MKTATLPSIRVEPGFRQAAEALLEQGESLSQFVETAVRESVQRRRNQAEFLARGMASLAAAQASGRYVEAAATLGKLEGMLTDAKRVASARKPSTRP